MAAITSFQDFWPYYLTQHRSRRTRYLHYAGALAAFIILAAAHVLSDWRLIPVSIAAGYAFAWVGHALYERNRPATFSYPLWSLRADFRMLWLWLIGGLDNELKKAGVSVATDLSDR